jgi:hypothetical protein
MIRIVLILVLFLGAGTVASAQQPNVPMPKVKLKKVKEPKIKGKLKEANSKLMTTPAEGGSGVPAGLTVTEEGVEENKKKKKGDITAK